MNYLEINGNTYEIADAEARAMDITATYTAGTGGSAGNLTINISSSSSDDNEEF